MKPYDFELYTNQDISHIVKSIRHDLLSRKNAIGEAILGDENGNIVAFGKLQIAAEAIIALDPGLNNLQKAKAIIQLLNIGIRTAAIHKIDKLYAYSIDPQYTSILRKHYGFTKIEGDALTMEIPDGPD